MEFMLECGPSATSTVQQIHKNHIHTWKRTMDVAAQRRYSSGNKVKNISDIDCVHSCASLSLFVYECNKKRRRRR